MNFDKNVHESLIDPEETMEDQNIQSFNDNKGIKTQLFAAKTNVFANLNMGQIKNLDEKAQISAEESIIENMDRFIENYG